MEEEVVEWIPFFNEIRTRYMRSLSIEIDRFQFVMPAAILKVLNRIYLYREATISNDINDRQKEQGM